MRLRSESKTMEGSVKILIADDEEDILEVMKKRIVKEGYTVVTAKDGLDAWQKIASESPDIILLDLNMPVMNGLDVLKRLRETPPSEKWQPVIIISATGELDMIQKGLSLEADHYLVKPCHMDDILKGIRLMHSLIPQRKMLKEDK